MTAVVFVESRSAQLQHTVLVADEALRVTLILFL